MNATQSASGSRLLIFAALIFLVFAFAFGLRLYWFSEPPPPELLSGLPDSRTEADQQLFVSRLRAAFATGGPEGDLAAALARQGFRIAPAPERAARYDRRAGLNDKCRRSGNVRWSADAAGRVTEVTGGYYQHCP